LGFWGVAVTRPYICAGLVLALVAGPATAQPAVESFADQAKSWWTGYLKDSKLVALPGGRKLNLYCQGKGAPVVILESGLGAGAFNWRFVQASIARTTRVCSYDRAGYWKSPPATGARDAGAEADDLAALLKAAKLPAPYLLVAHSMGGHIARLYAGRHTSDVAGMVLVDPSVEYQDKVLAEIIPTAPPMLAADMKRRAACASDPRPADVTGKCLDPAPPADLPKESADWFVAAQTPSYSAATLHEYQAMGAASSDALVAEKKSLGGRPLILLNAGNKMQLLPGQSEEQTNALTAVWLQKHREMLSISEQSELRMVEGSGHFIPREKPDAVVRAVNDMVRELRTKRR
jgi:pimeloyl-ACP methyl ester carboxylesterase